MSSKTPLLLSQDVADIMAAEGITRDQITGWEVFDGCWFVMVRDKGTYTVSLTKKAVVDVTNHT